MPVTLGLLGGGAQADEVEEFAHPRHVLFRAVDTAFVAAGDDRTLDIATRDPELLAVPVVGAVGAPALRRELVERWAGGTFATVVAEHAIVARSVQIGHGSMVAPGAVLSTRSVLAEHVLVNIGATISHDTVLGPFATVSPGSHVAGHCVIGAGVFLGIGSAVIEGVMIAEGAIVTAGAVVVRDITEPGVYAGVPSVLVRDHSGWLRELRGQRR